MHRALLSFVFGAVSSIAYSPINCFPILWLSFPALVIFMQGVRNAKQGFVIGWCFAFGSMLFSLYWIAASMFVDIAQFWWAVPLAVAGLPAFFAIYYGIAMAATAKFGVRNVSGAILVALLWFLADYARGHVFGGFPWNLEGYTWARVLPALQIVSVIGIYGLTLLTLIAACLPALLVDKNKRNLAVVASSLILFGLIVLWGGERLHHASEATVPNVRLRLVQPNTDQAHKWLPDQREKNFQQLLDLSSAPADKPVTHIIWPETAATFYLVEDVEHRLRLAPYVPQGGAIMTGVIRRSEDAAGKLHYYNSLIAIDDHARVVAGYDKVHLVPFGEFMPLRRFVPIPALVNLGLDFSFGDAARSLRVIGLPPFSPLICYEVIFSGDVVDRDDRPQFLMNITNDGWYGRTAGPYQHFANAKFRAVEEGLPLVRAANTGISGVVDAYGRITARLGVGKTGYLDADLPQALEPTFFSRYKEIPLWALFGIATLYVFLSLISGRKARK